jgi:hypothetical protein
LNDGNVPTAQVPELAPENIRLQCNVKYHETLFEILAKQYESARLDESKTGPALQILDHPTAPEEKSGPPRMLIVLAMTLSAEILAFSGFCTEQIVTPCGTGRSSLRPRKIESKIERSNAVRQSSHRDDVDTGRSDFTNPVQRDATARFYEGSSCDLLDGCARFRRTEVVEHDGIYFRSEYRFDLISTINLNLDV